MRIPLDTQLGSILAARELNTQFEARKEQLAFLPSGLLVDKSPVLLCASAYTTGTTAYCRPAARVDADEVPVQYDDC